MSAIADFRLIETSNLNELKEQATIKTERKLFKKKVIDNYWTFLDANTKKLKDFDWSGYIFANLLVFLQEKKGIDLMNSEFDAIANEIMTKRENSTFIFTIEHKKKYLEKLDPSMFSTDELIAFNKEFSEEDDPDLAKAELEGIKTLKENIGMINDDKKVVMLSVG